jgi:mannan polymerase II complex ANP1 subunit
MEQERQAREAEEKEKADRMKKIANQFNNPENEWEKDKTDIQNMAIQEKAKEQLAAADPLNQAQEQAQGQAKPQEQVQGSPQGQGQAQVAGQAAAAPAGQAVAGEVGNSDTHLHGPSTNQI